MAVAALASVVRIITPGGWNRHARHTIRAAVERGADLLELARHTWESAADLWKPSTLAEEASKAMLVAVLAGEVAPSSRLCPHELAGNPAGDVLFVVAMYGKEGLGGNDDATRTIANLLGDVAVTLAGRASEHGVDVARTFALRLQEGLGA